MSVNKKLTVSASPHVRSPHTVSGIMLDVIIALIPSLIAAVVIFGYRVLMVTLVCVGSAVLSEYLSRKVMKRHQTISDLSAVVTGLLLAFNLPVSIPLWIAALGSIIAIVVVKQMFGGIGQNFVNPALAARIILLMSFPSAMANWATDSKFITTSATPLANISVPSEVMTSFAGETEELPSLLDMFLGLHGGCFGEVCSLALIIGGIYLVVRKVISPAIPLAYIGTVAVFMLIAGRGDFEFVAYQLLGGGLLLGAIFMATDYTTCPVSFKGKIIFGIGCGVITTVIRLFGSLPEGVSFSIILMNLLVPHIERLTTAKPFGTPKKDKREEKAAKKAEKEAVKV
ncbi:MAG: RnfABCDGE type electron transport complex subunit D [Clostridia bacterium]|nr:RnfABCDGE type electron transport complex subunit D [Clostridia bacterium]MBR6635626.1 RnfABCDGE type electron transport complex subunit D [Clostridia bacterium]